MHGSWIKQDVLLKEDVVDVIVVAEYSCLLLLVFRGSYIKKQLALLLLSPLQTS